MFTYLLFSYIWSKRCHNVTFPTSSLQEKKIIFLQRVNDVGFRIKYQRCSNNVVFLYLHRENGFLILSGSLPGSLIRNSYLFSGGKFDRIVV